MKIKIILFFTLISFFYSCLGQDSTGLDCNNKAIDKGWEKKIGPGVCIREGFTINFVYDGFDYNKDGIDDLAVRYTIYPLKDGNFSYYALFSGLKTNEFEFVKEFDNLAFPIILESNYHYFQKHPIADSLSKIYPLDRTIEFNEDTLTLSIKTSIEFGKSYHFVFESKSNNWFMTSYNFWVGEIPSWYVENMSLNSKLINEKVVLETKYLNTHLPLNDFDLIKSYQLAKEEVAYLEMTYDIYEIY